MIRYDEALAMILSKAIPVKEEVVCIDEAIGRVLAEDIVADRDYPPFHRSAMDGYAIATPDWEKGIRSFSIKGTIYAGDAIKEPIQQGECYKIMTGAAVGHGADAVIRVEDAQEKSSHVSFMVDKIRPWQNIARQGEDAKSGEVLIQKGKLINHLALAGLATLGKQQVAVKMLPSIAILSTGNELIEVGYPVSAVQIRDSNSYSIAGFLDKYRIKANFRKIIKDNPDVLHREISDAINRQITIISGGVSAGDADFVPQAMADCGVQQVFHKVQIKPGKPIWFGTTSTGNVVFALPGNPISVQVALRIFVEPYLKAIFELHPQKTFRLPMAEHRKKKVKLDEFFPCVLQSEEATSIVEMHSNGSGDIRATTGADGFALHSAESDDLAKGDIVCFYSTRGD